MFGFGPFAGFLTLSFATIGFLSKLLAEDIEDVDESPGRSDSRHRSPLVAARKLWDPAPGHAAADRPELLPARHCFRESAVIGIVGAGGIGATLNTAIDR